MGSLLSGRDMFLSMSVNHLIFVSCPASDARTTQADFFTKAMSFPRRSAGVATFFLKLAGT